jgi:hypothetical protein
MNSRAGRRTDARGRRRRDRTARAPVAASQSPDDELLQGIRGALLPLLTEKDVREKTALRIYHNLNQLRRRTKRVNFATFARPAFLDFEGKVARVVSHFAPDGLTLEDFLRGAIRRPQILGMNPDTLIANIEAVCGHFREHGLTRQKYLRLGVKQPQLFYQKPETLISNVERVVERFRDDGLTAEKYLRALVRQSALFYRDPRTIIALIERIAGLFKEGLVDKPSLTGWPATDAAPALKFMLNNSMVFVMCEENIALRETYARVTGTRSARKVLRTYRWWIERELREALGTEPAHGGGRHRAGPRPVRSDKLGRN